ncbi:serine/threonine-protein phosphatase 6 regulatory ankyrin repeat subunit B-like [Euwallacea fornicatus]|uniref:serine/threonine-protein phosphatase 6 regulatory ankyrin repeat subunit B-like n=1 Tax=Euwallacea fornicatus TaxID=995702 RepID=UPI00338EFAF9
MATIYDKLKEKSELYMTNFTNEEEKLPTYLECFLFNPNKFYFLVYGTPPFQVIGRIKNCINTLSTKLRDRYETNLMCFSWEQCNEVIKATDTIYKLPNLIILDFDRPRVDPRDIDLLRNLCNYASASSNTKIIVVLALESKNVGLVFETYIHKTRYMKLDYFDTKLDIRRKSMENKPESLFQAALSGKLYHVARLIIVGTDINMRDERSNTALHLAARNGHKEIVLFLLDHGAKHLFNEDGFAPLHLACSAGQVEIVHCLLIRNADANISDEYRLTPLHLACASGRNEIVILLIEYGANVEVHTKIFRTPLYAAAYRNHDKVIETLLNYRAQVDYLLPDHLTALHGAARSGAFEAVKVLIEYGANRNTLYEGKTALEIAQSRGFTEIVEYLEVDEYSE